MNSLRYLLASLALGLIAAFASENMFWIIAPYPLAPPELAFIWAMYALCCAAALSAVALTGIRGLPAAFLGAAIMGWLIEGVVEGTMYLAFPFQLAWTPLAWHALISGVGVFALGRAAPHWPRWRRIGAWALLGLFIGFWAQYWPLEHEALPDLPRLLAYLAGFGVAVPLAHLLLDRLTPLSLPPRWVLMIAPLALAALWVLQSLAAPSPLRLSLPLLLWITIRAMKRLGTGRGPVNFGAPAHRPLRHFSFLIAPLIGAVLAVEGWRLTGGFEANVALVLTTVPASVIWWLWLMIRAERAGRPAGAGMRREPSAEDRPGTQS